MNERGLGVRIVYSGNLLFTFRQISTNVLKKGKLKQHFSPRSNFVSYKQNFTQQHLKR